MIGKYRRGIKRRLLLAYSGIVNRVNILIDNINVDSNVRLNGVVRFINDGKIRIGKQTVINSGKFFNPIGGATQCVIHTFPNAVISIGANCGISNSAIISAEKIVIGDNVKIGGDVKIYDTDYHSIDFIDRRDASTDIPNTAAVEIKDDVFIGTGSIILKSVTIGERSIIGAGSVVTKDIPADQLWAGSPCKFIKCLNDK